MRRTKKVELRRDPPYAAAFHGGRRQPASPRSYNQQRFPGDGLRFENDDIPQGSPCRSANLRLCRLPRSDLRSPTGAVSESYTAGFRTAIFQIELPDHSIGVGREREIDYSRSTIYIPDGDRRQRRLPLFTFHGSERRGCIRFIGDFHAHRREQMAFGLKSTPAAFRRVRPRTGLRFPPSKQAYLRVSWCLRKGRQIFPIVLICRRDTNLLEYRTVSPSTLARATRFGTKR